jgi:hypothetical protein
MLLKFPIKESIMKGIAYLAVLLSLPSILYAFENKYTHPAITKEAVNNTTSQIDDYLKMQNWNRR